MTDTSESPAMEPVKSNGALEVSELVKVHEADLSAPGVSHDLSAPGVSHDLSAPGVSHDPSAARPLQAFDPFVVPLVVPLGTFEPPPGENWAEAAPMLFYDPAANDYQVVIGLAVDVREWGGGVPVIILRPRDPLKVSLATGEVVEVEAKTSIAVPAVCELFGVVDDLSRTEEALELAFQPIAIRTFANGRKVLQFRCLTRPSGVPRKMLR